MKSILMLLVSLSSMNSAAHAQNLFSTYASINELNLVKCMNDQIRVFDRYGKQLNSEIVRGLQGLVSEKRNQTLDVTGLKELEKTISLLVMKKILVDELNRQADAVVNDPRVQASPREAMAVQNLFNTESMDVELNRQFKEILEQAAEQEGLGKIIVHTFLHELQQHAVVELGERTLHAIGNGLFMEIIKGTALQSLTMGAAKNAVVGFGSSVIKGAGFATFLTLLTEPLKGGRKPPETIWLEILSKNPELILNPEWMKEAGSPDSPWQTHCYTINRKGKELSKVLQKLIKKEESSFLNKIVSIQDKNKSRAQLGNPFGMDLTIPADNTAVYQPVPIEVRVPFWAQKKK